MSPKTKQSVLDIAKKRYIAKFMKDLKLPQDPSAQNPPAPPAQNPPAPATQPGPPSPGEVVNQLKQA